MGSSLQLLFGRRWEVVCVNQNETAHPCPFICSCPWRCLPGHDNGVIEQQQHEGPHCRDMKDQVCHKKPKESEHEECYIDYEIILDVTYIESCHYVQATHCEEEAQTILHHSQIVGQDSRVVDYYEKG